MCSIERVTISNRILSDNIDSAVWDPSLDRKTDSFEVNYVWSP
jgi:hypothetical protein